MGSSPADNQPSRGEASTDVPDLSVLPLRGEPGDPGWRAIPGEPSGTLAWWNGKIYLAVAFWAVDHWEYVTDNWSGANPAPGVLPAGADDPRRFGWWQAPDGQWHLPPPARDRRAHRPPPAGNGLLPPPPGNPPGRRPRLIGCVGLVMVVIVALVGSYAVVDRLANVGSPGPFVCPATGSTDVAAPPTTTPGAPRPDSALDIAQRLTPNLAGGRSLATRESTTTVSGLPEELRYLFPDQFRPTDWSITPGMNRVTSPFQYTWGTSALGNPDMSGVRSGEASVQVYDSPAARLADEKIQAAEAKRCPWP